MWVFSPKLGNALVSAFVKFSWDWLQYLSLNITNPRTSICRLISYKKINNDIVHMIKSKSSLLLSFF